MARVLQAPQAEADLVDIWLYVAEDSEARATALLQRIGRTIDDVAERPLRGTARDDLLPGVGLRSVPVGNYLVFYRPIGSGVEVLRVLHGARDLDALL